MLYATVNPSDTTDISDTDLDGLAMADNDYVRISDYAGGERSFAISSGAVPEWNLYDMDVVDAGAPGDPRFYIRSWTLTFAVDRVTKTASYAEIPIAELYSIKRNEIFAYDQQVRYNAVDTSLAGAWWLIVSQDARFELDGIQGNWAQRQINSQGWPGGANAPWVGILNANTEDTRRVQVTASADWDTLYLEKTLHDQATGNATDASVTALDAAYDDGAGVWQDVADHDAQDPAWGYPPSIQA